MKEEGLYGRMNPSDDDVRVQCDEAMRCRVAVGARRRAGWLSRVRALLVPARGPDPVRDRMTEMYQ